MKLQIVPASRGAQWVRQGFAVFFSKPLAFMGLFGLWLLGTLVAQLLPWIGFLLVWGTMPLVTLGFMLATQQALQGQFPTLKVFVAPLRGTPQQKRALWQLGALYAGAMLCVALIYVLIDGGRFQTAMQATMASGKASPESVEALFSDNRVQFSLLWILTAISVLSVPFWHAPALVHWGGQPAAKALFFSTVACWRNKWAFAVYALTGASALMGLAIASAMLLALLGQPGLAVLVIPPLGFAFYAVFYASLFFTFVDCFEMPSAPLAIEEATP
jgi:hypothetical protein